MFAWPSESETDAPDPVAVQFGDVIWAKDAGGGSSANAIVYSMVIDNSGNIITTGIYFGTGSITIGTTTLPTPTSEDIFYSDRLNATQWSEPHSVGHPVNSEGYEGFPSISADGNSLYFMRVNFRVSLVKTV